MDSVYTRILKTIATNDSLHPLQLCSKRLRRLAIGGERDDADEATLDLNRHAAIVRVGRQHDPVDQGAQRRGSLRSRLGVGQRRLEVGDLTATIRDNRRMERNDRLRILLLHLGHSRVTIVPHFGQRLAELIERPGPGADRGNQAVDRRGRGGQPAFDGIRSRRILAARFAYFS